MNVPWELIDAFLDDELTPEQEAELRDWLIADREHVRVFVRATHLHRSLRTEMLAQKVLPGGRALSPTDDQEFDKEPGGMGNLSPSPATRVNTPASQRGVLPFPQLHRGRFIRARGAIFAMAASIALLVGLSVWLFPSTNNEPTLAVPTGTQATLERNGQSFQAQDGLKLLPSDLLRIFGSNGAAIGYGKENTRVVLKDDTELKTLAWQKGKRFELRQGKLEALVARQRPFGPMVLLTMQAEARVLGTKFMLAATTNATRLEVSEGKVKLTRMSDNSSVKVSAGHYAVAAKNYALAAQPLPGKVLREFWLDLPGGSLQDLTYHPRYPNAPSGYDFPASFETNTNWPSAFGTRTRAYVLPPVTGEYEFRIAGIGQVCLWLSPDDNPAERVKIGQIIFTRNRPGGEGPEATRSRQESGPIPLEAGRRYYIEVAHKYGTGEDLLSVTWKRPDGTEEPIPAEFLSPFIPKKNGTER